MKTFKVLTLILLLAFASCKKDGGVKPGPEVNPTVTSADLLDYNIVALLNTASGLRVIYFNKEGNIIKATMDGVTSRRILPVNIVNNTLTMDTNGDGSIIYTFGFEKDKSGKLGLVAVSYKNQGDASIKVVEAILLKNADIPVFAGLEFVGKYSNGPLTYLKFSNDHNFAWSPDPGFAVGGWAGYYDLCPGAWKGKYNSVDYMGVTGTGVMVVQRAGDTGVYSFVIH